MNLATARAYVRQNARNAGSAAVYGDRDVDTALVNLANRFLRVTGLLTRTDTIASSTATPATLDVSSIATGAAANTSFAPRRLKRAYIAGNDKPLDKVEYDSLLWRLTNQPATATPTTIAWVPSTAVPTTAAVLYPSPSASANVSLSWWLPFTVFQIGAQGAYATTTQYYVGDVVSSGGHAYQALKDSLNVALNTAATWLDLGTGVTVDDPTTLVLNVPGDVLSEILPGAAAILQVNEPEYTATSSANWLRYLEVEQQYKGESGDGSNHTVARVFEHGVDGE